MSKIIFKSQKFLTVSVRLKTDTLAIIDSVTKNIGSMLGDEISRNQVLEKLIEDAIDNSIFVINGEEMTFAEILKCKDDLTEEVKPEFIKEDCSKTTENFNEYEQSLFEIIMDTYKRKEYELISLIDGELIDNLYSINDEALNCELEKFKQLPLQFQQSALLVVERKLRDFVSNTGQ